MATLSAQLGPSANLKAGPQSRGTLQSVNMCKCPVSFVGQCHFSITICISHRNQKLWHIFAAHTNALISRSSASLLIVLTLLYLHVLIDSKIEKLQLLEALVLELYQRTAKNACMFRLPQEALHLLKLTNNETSVIQKKSLKMLGHAKWRSREQHAPIDQKVLVFCYCWATKLREKKNKWNWIKRGRETRRHCDTSSSSTKT